MHITPVKTDSLWTEIEGVLFIKMRPTVYVLRDEKQQFIPSQVCYEMASQEPLKENYVGMD